MESYEQLEVDDPVRWADPNDDFGIKVCRVRFIHNWDDGIRSDTIVTIMDDESNVYDVFACELESE